MPYQVTIQNQTVEIPASLDEVTIGGLINLRHVNPQSPIEILDWGTSKRLILTDSLSTQRQVANTLSVIDSTIKKITDWMQTDERLRTPEKITLMGLEIVIKPDLLQSLPYWGSVMCKNIVKEQHELCEKNGVEFDATDRIPEIIAHYLYEKVTRSKYDESKANEFARDVIAKQMCMVEAIQLGNFFLLRQKHYFLGRKERLLTSLTVMSKKLVLKFSRNTGT